MDCTQAQDLLLSMEDPGAIEQMEPELRRHVESCAQCAAVAARVRQIEALVPELPVPAAASAASRAVLNTRIKMPVLSAMSYRPMRMQRLALAAGLLLVVGLSLSILLLLSQPADASTDLVGQLVDWNVEMAQAPNQFERSRLYHEREVAFSKSLAHNTLSADESTLAKALFEQGFWLSEHDDPLAAADRFCSVNELLASQGQRDAAKKNYRASAVRVSESQRIRRAGIEANLVLVSKQASSEQKDLIERVSRRDRTTAAALARLAEHPDIREHLKAQPKRSPKTEPETQL